VTISLVGGPAEEVFVGRKPELARFAEVMARVRGGQPWLLSLEGESGVGKSALARQFLALSPGLTSLWSRADPAESELDYGIVEQLLGDLRHQPGSGDSLGAEIAKSSPFALGAQFLRVVGEQLAAGPVAVIIDDVQWADRRSVEALSFMFRRLTMDPVVVIVLVRGDRDQLDESTRRMLLSVDHHQRMALSGLSIDDVPPLAEALGAASLDATGIARLHERTGGHALYLRTALSDPAARERSSRDAVAVPASLGAVIGDQLTLLPGATRVLLEMLAVVDTPIPLVLLGEAAGVEEPSAALEPAMRAGLVDLSHNDLSRHVVIRHPLQRDAIYEGMSPARRRELHARAVGLVGESSGWAHRVAALERPDESLAAELERLAEREALSGRFVLAATRLQWAADISPAPADRERRVLTAAFHLTVADEGRGESLRPVVEASSPSALRSCILATMASSAGGLAEGERLYRDALSQARSDPDSLPLAAMTANRLAGLYALRGDGQRTKELGQWALAQDCLGVAGVGRAHALVAVGVTQTAGPLAALSELGYLEPDPLRVDPVDIDGLCWRGVCRFLLGDLGAAICDLTASLAMVRNGATLTLGLRVYGYLALAQYLAGEWDEALITTEQGFSAAAVRPRRPELPLLHLAAGALAAGRGLADDAESHVNEAEATAASIDYVQERVYAVVARAMVCQATSDYLGMSDALGGWEEESPIDSRTPMWALFWRPLLVEGLLGSAQTGRAATALDKLGLEGAEVTYLQPALAWLQGWLAEQRGSPEEALHLYQRGEETAGEGSSVFRGRLLLAHGRLLRRLGQRRAALKRLRGANEVFLNLRAAPFVARTEAELSACGLRQQPAKQRSVLQMTARESEVAHLVGQGMTNAEIGAELFVTPKAVEYHLGNLYAKLGLKGRRELRRFVDGTRRPAPG
jgi:DNA-binding CsgD family transcriptional regulator/tetratricopeptide (TPR) repeat protein